MREVLELLDAFNAITPEERIFQTQIRQFVQSNRDNCLLRSNLIAHLTASAWVVDRDSMKQALLVRHAKLNRWLQPGGHADGDADLARVALKEVEEETGLKISEKPTEIFDLDVHLIPLHKEVPPHLHLDLRFLLLADVQAPITVSPESHEVRWVHFDHIPALGVDASVMRLLNKTLQAAR